MRFVCDVKNLITISNNDDFAKYKILFSCPLVSWVSLWNFITIGGSLASLA